MGRNQNETGFFFCSEETIFIKPYKLEMPCNGKEWKQHNG